MGFLGKLVSNSELGTSFSKGIAKQQQRSQQVQATSAKRQVERRDLDQIESQQAATINENKRLLNQATELAYAQREAQSRVDSIKQEIERLREAKASASHPEQQKDIEKTMTQEFLKREAFEKELTNITQKYEDVQSALQATQGTPTRTYQDERAEEFRNIGRGKGPTPRYPDRDYSDDPSYSNPEYFRDNPR
jgi:chromosome segregation ATPase